MLYEVITKALVIQRFGKEVAKERIPRRRGVHDLDGIDAASRLFVAPHADSAAFAEREQHVHLRIEFLQLRQYIHFQLAFGDGDSFNLVDDQPVNSYNFV